MHICEWMLANDLHAFSDLDKHEVARLREYSESRGQRQGKSKITKTPTTTTHRVLQHRLDPLRDLVKLRDVIDDTPNWNPKADIAEVEAVPSTSQPTGEIPAIPFEIAIPLYTQAMRWVTVYAPIIIQAKNAARKAYLDRHREVSSRSLWHQAAVKAIKNSGGELKIADKSINLGTIGGKDEFNSYIGMLQAACYCIIAGFSGMRVSELSSIETDCLIVVRPDSGGDAQICLQAKTFKTAVGSSEEARWVVGFDQPDNPVRLAVNVLINLFADERKESDISWLFVNGGVKFSMTLDVTAMTSSIINQRLSEFLAAIMPDAEWTLTTHQFRKTFARFVVRHHKLGLLALKRHFKHVSLAMTDFYTGTDSDILVSIGEERSKAMRDALHEVLGSTFLAGKLGEQIVSRNQQFRGAAGRQARDEYIDAFMANGDVPVLNHPYGLCFAFRDTARCQLNSERVGLQTCLPCHNFVVGPEHASWWQGRLGEMDAFERDMIGAGLWSETRASALQDDRFLAVSVLETISKAVPHET